jgi:hypothetical protein
LVTALADAEFVPFTYVVDDVSLTVTFSPADVSSPKPDVDTLLTLPDDPPDAGPDRALDPPPLDPELAVKLLKDAPCAPVEGAAAAGGVEAPAPPVSPIAGPISAAAAIHPLLFSERSRRSLDRRVGLPCRPTPMDLAATPRAAVWS